MIREISFNDVFDFASNYFSDFNIGNNPFCKIYGYYLSNTLVGFICVSVIYERVEIDYLAVSSKYRGSGVAQKLFDYVMDVFSPLNVSLEVRCDNDRAIGFYLKNGFKKVSVRSHYYNGIDGYLMVKEVF